VIGDADIAGSIFHTNAELNSHRLAIIKESAVSYPNNHDMGSIRRAS